MWETGLSAEGREAVKAAFLSNNRLVRFRAQLHNKNFQPLPTELVLEEDAGEIVLDRTRRKDEPMMSAALSVLDPDRRLPDARDPIWLSRNVSVVVEEWIWALGTWYEIPLFYGPIGEVERQGSRIILSADSKDVQHLDPHLFFKTVSINEHTRVNRAIRIMAEARGEVKFNLKNQAQRLPRSRVFTADKEPFRVWTNLAENVADCFLQYRGNGTLWMRDKPTEPAWKFEGVSKSTLVEYPAEKTSIAPVRNAVIGIGQKTVKQQVTKKTSLRRAVDNSDLPTDEIRLQNNDGAAPGRKIKIGQGVRLENHKIKTVSGNIITLNRNLQRPKNKGAPVEITYKEDRIKPLYAQAKIPASEPLSDRFLTGGDRPRADIKNWVNVSNLKRLRELTQRRRDRLRAKVENEVSVSTVPIWPLELGDIFVVSFEGVEHRSRIQRMTIPLSLSGIMELNWQGRRIPTAKKHQKPKLPVFPPGFIPPRGR